MAGTEIQPRRRFVNPGLEFQKRVEATLKRYRAEGSLRAFKTDPPVRVLGFGPARKVIFLANPFLDFMGAWTARGARAVVFECKSTAEPRLRFDQESGLTEVQLTELRNWHNAGAVAFVLWEYDGRVKLFPAPVLARCRDAYRADEACKYVSWFEDDPGPDIPEGRFKPVDFLPEMGRLWRAPLK